MSRKLDRYTIVIDGDNKKLELSARNTVNSLGGVDRAAKKTNGSTGKLSDGFRHASTNAAAFQGPLGGVSGRLGAMSSLLGNVNPMMVGLGLAVSGVTLFMTGAIKEHDQFALRNKKQEALLKSTGNAAGFAAHELDAMAKSVALNTLASVEGIKDTQNVLLTFKGISEESFSTAITLSQDMAAVMGTDSKAAALQLGKALESPTEGISALKRAGVSFSQSEKDMIRDMEETGRVADAQTFILETLKNQIGGAGSAEADTLSGAVDTLSQNWQELKINIADSSGAAAGVQAFINLMAEAADGWNKMIFTEDNVRLSELAAERYALKEELKSLYSGERTGFLSWIVGTESEAMNVERRLKTVTAEMEQIQNKRKGEQVDEKEANDAAIENQKKNADELIALKAAQDAKELAKVHAKNAAELSAMDMKFADEEEKINLNYDNNLEKINNWQVSEAEIRRRGFENIEALRDYYRNLADEKLNQDFMKLEEKYAEHNAKVTEEKSSSVNEQLALDRDYARKREALEQSLQSNLLRLGHTLAGDNKKLQLGMLAIETFIGAKKAVINGYVAGAAAAAAMAPMGPAAAAAANTKMITMGYANAAVIGATGIAQGVAMSKGSSSGGSVSSSFESGVESNVISNDEQVTSINAASERRAGASVVYNGPYIEKVETMDSESFDQFAQRNSNSIARATAAGYEEYGVTLGA